MSDVVIKAENLGKSYIIGHKAADGRYVALRDVLMQNARGLWHKTRDLMQGKPIILGDTVEEIWALKDVSFEIRRGEAVGIIGRNGAGKSTLLKVLSRITEPSAGRVTIKGRAASLLEVGTGFHPELTGRENIYLNGAILGMSRAEIKRKFAEIVAFAETEKFLDTPVKRYSSGMYVRLAFAVAAHLEPEILVVDEVLAVGDTQFQTKCLGKMGDVAKEGRTVLFVSHNMAAMRRLCESGLWLSEGRLMALGPVEDAIQAYLHAFQMEANTFAIRSPDDAQKSMQILGACLQMPARGVFSTADQLTFELDVLTRSSVPGACVSVNVYDQQDRLVYWAGDTSSEWFQKPRLGSSKASCRFAPYLLTPGRYSATVGIFAFGRGVIDAESERRIMFEVEDTDSVFAVYGFKQRGTTGIPSEWSWK